MVRSFLGWIEWCVWLCLYMYIVISHQLMHVSLMYMVHVHCEILIQVSQHGCNLSPVVILCILMRDNYLFRSALLQTLSRMLLLENLTKCLMVSFWCVGLHYSKQ